jgi:hypothetical protein
MIKRLKDEETEKQMTKSRDDNNYMGELDNEF